MCILRAGTFTQFGKCWAGVCGAKHLAAAVKIKIPQFGWGKMFQRRAGN